MELWPALHWPETFLKSAGHHYETLEPLLWSYALPCTAREVLKLGKPQLWSSKLPCTFETSLNLPCQRDKLWTNFPGPPSLSHMKRLGWRDDAKEKDHHDEASFTHPKFA
jgi:hypothetical protein